MYRKTLPINAINNLQIVNEAYIKLQESEVSELIKAHKAELTQYIYISVLKRTQVKLIGPKL